MYEALNWIESYITEEYVGRMPELAKISELFENMADKYTKLNGDINPNNCKETYDIEHIFCELFGCKKFILNWIPVDDMNACAPISFDILHAQGIYEPLEKVPGKGYYDPSHRRTFAVFIWAGLLNKTDIGLTGSEIVAIVLHEIGHNLDEDVVFSLGPIIASICKFMGDISPMKIGEMNIIIKESMLFRDPINALAYIIDRLTPENRKYLNLFIKIIRNFRKTTVYGLLVNGSTINHIVERIKRNKQKFKDVVKMVKAGGWIALKIVMKPFELFTFTNNLFGRINMTRSEQFADSIVAMYGFSSELMTGLEKLSDTFDGRLSGTPKFDPFANTTVGNIMLDLRIAVGEFYSVLTQEVHGTHQLRGKGMLIKLKRDLANGNFKPEMKRELQQEIAKLEEEYDKLLSLDENSKMVVTVTFRKLLEVLFDGRPQLLQLFGLHQA